MGIQLDFDARALTEPIDAEDFAAFRRSGAAPVRGSRLPFLAAAVPGVVMLLIGITVVSVQGSPAAALPVVVFGSVFVVVTLVSARSTRTARTLQRQVYRLRRFAAANGLGFTTAVRDPQLPGMLFGLGHTRVAEMIVHSDHPRPVQFGEYRYTVGSGQNARTHRWTYAAIRLASPLPHIVLDAAANDGLGSSLPVSFDRAQRLSLEGDFDRHFALSCPPGYERDALYLFTPDVMAQFIDAVGAFDAEIVDEWVFLYARVRRNESLSPEAWAWRFRAMRALLTKVSQWERWRDERLTAPLAVAPVLRDPLPPFINAGPRHAPAPVTPAHLDRPGVARHGRRLRTTMRWTPLLGFGGMVVFWAVSNLWRVTG